MLYLLLGLLLLSGDRARGTLAGAGVGLAALAADGQALTMTAAAIGADLDEALKWFAGRERRFGKTSEQIRNGA